MISCSTESSRPTIFVPVLIPVFHFASELLLGLSTKKADHCAECCAQPGTRLETDVHQTVALVCEECSMLGDSERDYSLLERERELLAA